MKTFIHLFFVILFLNLKSNLYSQCYEFKFCNNKDLGDYDYRSQSSFAMLSPGDTSKTNIILYSKQKYRILVCSDPNLGDIHYTIIEPVTEYKRVIDTIIELKPDEVTYPEEYAEEDYYSEDTEEFTTEETPSEPMKPTYDTIWETIKNVNEVVIFDSKQNPTGKNYWESEMKRTKRLVVKVIVSPVGGGEEIKECVNILVGRKSADTKKFTPHQ